MDTQYTARASGSEGFELFGELHGMSKSPEQKLAGAVLLEALMDCRRVFQREGLKQARRTGAYFDIAYPLSMVRFWCEAIDIDADVLAERFRENMQHERSAKRMFDALAGQAKRGLKS